jgi:hypothetical protein
VLTPSSGQRNELNVKQYMHIGRESALRKPIARRTENPVIMRYLYAEVW